MVFVRYAVKFLMKTNLEQAAIVDKQLVPERDI